MSKLLVRDLMTADVVAVRPADTLATLEDTILERLRVRELMTTGVESTEAERDIRDAAQVMLENKYGCLPVVEGERLVGILTEADFVRLFAEETFDAGVALAGGAGG
ncbi:MAG: CBS domain-containing protein [Thermoanaerobaculia bacterium]